MHQKNWEAEELIESWTLILSRQCAIAEESTPASSIHFEAMEMPEAISCSSF